MNDFNWKLIAGIAGGVLLAAFLVWFFFFRQTTTLAPTETPPQQTLGQSDVRADATEGMEETNVAERIPSPTSQQKIFKISDGPVAGASFMQELRPTTTIARFVMQQNGHVLDLALDSPGSVARAASNTTIPGAARVVWLTQEVERRLVAAGVALQYLDNSAIKTAVLTFPVATSSAATTVRAPVRIQFLPDNILDIAPSPDGKSLAYLLRFGSGADGYIARADGTNARKLFSLPLAQVALSWPSAGTLVAASKAAAGVPGIALSIHAASGAVSPILYGQGLVAVADPSFTHVIYQTAAADRTTYVHDTKTNLDRPLSFGPNPKLCSWSRVLDSFMYCAAPFMYVPPEYLDLWNQGRATAADMILAYDLVTGDTTIIAIPGREDGGVASTIAEISVSADDQYLMYVKKGDRSLWGVRL
jgi:hypothetical protein